MVGDCRAGAQSEDESIARLQWPPNCIEAVVIPTDRERSDSGHLPISSVRRVLMNPGQTPARQVARLPGRPVYSSDHRSATYTLLSRLAAAYPGRAGA